MLFGQVLAIGWRHEGHAIGRVHGAGVQVGAGLDDGFVYVFFRRLGLALVVGRRDGFFRCGDDIGQRRPRQVHARSHGVTGGTGGYCSLEERLPFRDGIVFGADRARAGRLTGGFALATFLLLRQSQCRARYGAARYQDGARRPALVVHLADPIHEGDQVGDFTVREVLRRHEPPVALFVVELGRVFQEGGQVRCAAMLGDLGQVRRIVGAFTENSVTVDTVVAVPDILATHDAVGNGVGVGQLGELPVAVYRQDQEHQRRDGGGCDGEDAGLSLVHLDLPGYTPMPDQYAMPMMLA